MKREILFKGKSVNTCEWIESMTITKGATESTKDALFMEKDIDEWVEIVPDSLSQFVNETDKNGKKVFEGDYDKDGNCVVWCDTCKGFQFAGIVIDAKGIYVPCHNCDGNFHFNELIDEFEIIGNIADL